jgi:hypothetical protein
MVGTPNLFQKTGLLDLYLLSCQRGFGPVGTSGTAVTSDIPRQSLTRQLFFKAIKQSLL